MMLQNLQKCIKFTIHIIKNTMTQPDRDTISERIDDKAAQGTPEGGLSRLSVLIGVISCAVKKGVMEQIVGKMGSMDARPPRIQAKKMPKGTSPEEAWASAPRKDSKNLKKTSHRPPHSRTPYYFG